MCVDRGGGGVAGVSPPTRGQLAWGHMVPAYQGAVQHTCKYNPCSCNFTPGQYVSQDSCNKLIKGDPSL